MLRNTLAKFVVLMLGFPSCGPGSGDMTEGSTSPVTDNNTSSTGGATSTTTSTISTESPTSDVDSSATLDDTAVEPMEPCPSHPTTDACCCYEDVQNGTSNDGTVTVCGTTALCAPIHLVCAEGVQNCPIESLSSEMEDAITCALNALRGGQIGRISWVIDAVLMGYSREHLEVDINGNGTVFRHGGFYEDLYFEVYSVERKNLPNQAFFSDCLTSPDWRQRFDCVRQSVAGVSVETCLNGYNFSPGR